MNLIKLGWNENFEKEFTKLNENNNYIPGRVIVEYEHLYRVITEKGEFLSPVSGRFIHTATGKESYPSVGDWVVLDKPLSSNDTLRIHHVLKRKSKFSRKVAGVTTEEQVVASNIDKLFICMSLNDNFNIRRLERYIALAFKGKVEPIILLTKKDLCENPEEKINDILDSISNIKVYMISSKTLEGFNNVTDNMGIGTTVAFIGSSGVGKSTLINAILGEERQITKDISELGDRGKHTTTNRELIVLGDMGIVIDTPGMKEIQLLDLDEGLSNLFIDIENLSNSCKFTNCNHKNEPGCAILKALEDGTIDEERYKSFLKLKKEENHFKTREKSKSKEKNKSKNNKKYLLMKEKSY
ncbi:ribosome small subunit-dependent GTPase A [Clostridium sp.]|uniref:ribosome small subunit-dependent GTPase A n=1 Tax=Clostridium sp. TaxID=1506 RepID=UPI003463D2A8